MLVSSRQSIDALIGLDRSAPSWLYQELQRLAATIWTAIRGPGHSHLGEVVARCLVVVKHLAESVVRKNASLHLSS